MPSLRLLPRWERPRHTQPRTTAVSPPAAAEKPLIWAPKQIFTPRKEMSCKGRVIPVGLTTGIIDRERRLEDQRRGGTATFFSLHLRFLQRGR